jgi:cathepsin L
VAAIESAVAVETGSMVPLSEQQILDCGSNFGNGVCKGKNATGGTSITAYTYVMAQGGIDSEEAYPYRTYNHENCYFVTPVAAKISGERFESFF